MRSERPEAAASVFRFELQVRRDQRLTQGFGHRCSTHVVNDVSLDGLVQDGKLGRILKIVAEYPQGYAITALKDE